MRAEGRDLVTTRAVLTEIGNFLARTRRLREGIVFLEHIERDPAVEVVAVTEELYQTAFALFKRRQDKAWGLTDCISFVVMWERGIVDALTADGHFEQAGFRVLIGRP